ncbi:Protein of unknown function [Gryllus bimaculatus]|nr:Protein of unknown function [Gryllus bimaculatus]
MDFIEQEKLLCKKRKRFSAKCHFQDKMLANFRPPANDSSVFVFTEMELLNYFFISASTLVVAVILVIVSIWRKLSKSVPRPILIKEYWGPGNPKDDDHTILPFKIDVSNEELNDLQQRLRNVRKLTPPLEDNFRYGFNTEYLQKGAAKPGLGPAQMGVLFRVLMQRLGHFTFYVHGSDWGHCFGIPHKYGVFKFNVNQIQDDAG